MRPRTSAALRTDEAYGEQACYDLARNNPVAASNNAANYEHYYNGFWWRELS